MGYGLSVTGLLYAINTWMEGFTIVHNAGVSTMDVIKSATVNAADLLDMSETIGTIEVGKYADIVATDASALDDIKELLDVDFVMKSGKVYKQK